MFRSYFYLCRGARELNSLLKRKTIIDVYTQERDRMFMHIPLDDLQEHHVIIDCSPNLSHIYRRERHFKAKKNTFSLFNGYFPDEIRGIKIALNDRKIIFELSNSTLLFSIEGSASNVFLFNKSGIIPFKKTDDADIKLPLNFLDEGIEAASLINITGSSVPEWKEFSSPFPFAGKDIYLRAKALLKGESVEKFNLHIRDNIESVLNDKIAVYYDSFEHKPRFMPETFIIESETIEGLRIFDNYFEALNYYITLKHKKTDKIPVKNKIEKYLNQEIEKLASKLNSLKARIEAGSRENEYRNCGSLILANLNLIQKGSGIIELEDTVTGIMVKVKLDDKLSPQKNADRYFEKSKDERTNFEQSKELYTASLGKLEKLKGILSTVEEGMPDNELEILFGKLKINQQNRTSKMEDKFNFKHYILHGKYHVYVGKDSRNNDELTTQFAKQNDLWFHARGVAGSHVIIRVENTKEVIPKNIIKEAASIAAFFSKAKTSGTAPVAYTFRKYVHKKKGLAAGQVILDREDVVLVKPEIPKECEPVITEII